MGKSKIARIPYDERTDDHRLASNWKKATKQFERKDWSASIVRVATSAEISANIYIRQFLITDYALPSEFVDALLLGANGLDGKFKRLIKPVAKHRGTWAELRALQNKIAALNSHRNGIVHAGSFKNRKDAKSAFAHSFAIIQALAPHESASLVLPYES